MKWFGDGWGNAPVADNPGDRIAVPVGELCFWCNEPITENDFGLLYTDQRSYSHGECNLRNVLGNAEHLKGNCHYVGECNHLSTKSYRQEALEVWDYVNEGGLS